MNRTDIINHYAKIIDAQSYLEIGVANPEHNFNNVKINKKIGVDPGLSGFFEATHLMTSDEYFSQNTDAFDIIFIDGLHEKEQVIKDIENSLRTLNQKGIIICHDMNPTIKEYQLSSDDPRRYKYIKEQEKLGNTQADLWNGDCWKAFVVLRSTRPDLEMFVIDTDFGVGIIKRGTQQTIHVPIELDYEYLESNRKYLLNLISIQEFLNHTTDF